MSTNEEKNMQEQSGVANFSPAYLVGANESNGVVYEKPSNGDFMGGMQALMSELLGLTKQNLEDLEPQETKKEGIIDFSDEDLENKTFIVRIEVRDHQTGEKSEKGKIKFSKIDGTIKMDADAGMDEVNSPVEAAHGIFFTHMIQATREFIEDELDGDN